MGSCLERKPVETFTNPTLEATAKIVNDGFEKHKTLLLIGNCWVDYQGRASSTLGLGERIIIIKEDKALLVHRPRGYEPVNWMPGGKVTFHVSIVRLKNPDRSEKISQSSNKENARQNVPKPASSDCLLKYRQKSTGNIVNL